MKRPEEPTPPVSWQRRSLLDWLGRATVLGLASPLVQACGGGRGAVDDTAGALDQASSDADAHGGPSDLGWDHEPGPDSGVDVADGQPSGDDSGGDPTEVTTDPTSLTGGPCDAGALPTPSSKSSHPIYEGWNVRTVDEQALIDLLTNWRLRIDGLVAEPRTFTFCELLALATASQVTDFHCVEGWSVYDVPWDGVPLAALLELARPTAAATHVSIGCRGGIYAESLRLDVAREPRTLLALGVAGHTLPLPHGFPARVVVPRLLGYKNPKYVETLTLTDSELVGFWPKYGYTVSGEVPAERLRPGKY
jgi:hypothetical protein